MKTTTTTIMRFHCGSHSDVGHRRSSVLLAIGQDYVESVFGRLEGTCPPPDLRASFAKLDKESTGLLDRPRFALALRGLRPSMELSPELLRAAMEYFEDSTAVRGGRVGGGGTSRIDYRRVARIEAKDQGVGTRQKEVTRVGGSNENERDREG